jgi:hypothetical protein
MKGYGVYKTRNNRKYKGMWKDNKRHGKGILTWEDGRVYKGSGN